MQTRDNDCQSTLLYNPFSPSLMDRIPYAPTVRCIHVINAPRFSADAISSTEFL